MPVQEVHKQTAVGVMTGTSLDGIDVVVATVEDSGQGLRLEQQHFACVSFEAGLKEQLAQAMLPGAHARETAILDVELGRVLAQAVRQVLRAADVPLASVDVVGSHGQTVFHDPASGTTVQIGDPSVMAQLLGVTVVGDFRRADMALGGQGAPLVPYFDWCLFGHPTEHRVMLNLGGIANVTFLPAGGAQSDVMAFDTGPANLVVNAVMQRLLGSSMDEGGAVGLTAEPDAGLLTTLLDNPYFARKPPKSTGRELFSGQYADKLIREGRSRGLSDRCIVATATALTVRTVAEAIKGFGVLAGPGAGVPSSRKREAPAPPRVIVSGGGVHNRAIMDGLSSALAPIPVENMAAHGVDPDAKEALCFALLAVQAVRGVPCGMPSVTGASRAVVLGKICKAG